MANRFSVEITEDTRDRLKIVAAKQRMTMSALITKLVAQEEERIADTEIIELRG